MRIRGFAAAAAAGLVLVGALGTPASAETLTRKGGSATIKPVGAPAGALVTKARVTVKKGKKTVAKNRTSYKAKRKGTYKATSTITYKPRTTAKRASATHVFAKCRISSRTIISDRTTRHQWFDGTMYYAGQVTVRYQGNCTDDLWVGSTLKHVAFPATWTDDDYVMTDDLPVGADPTAAKYADLYYGIGDIDYVSGTDMSASSLPAIGWNYGAARTIKKTRTVVVR
jgi:hypothetical protein